MARVSAEQKLKFEMAVSDFLNNNPSASTESVGEALYDTWRSPGPEGNRPKEQRATDWAKRKLKELSKSGKVYQPKRGYWEASSNKESRPTILRKSNGEEKRSFTPINVFDAMGIDTDTNTDTNTNVVNHNDSSPVTFKRSTNDSFLDNVSQNSPFIRGLLLTAQRHGVVEMPEPMLHALIEELVMTTGNFNN